MFDMGHPFVTPHPQPKYSSIFPLNLKWDGVGKGKLEKIYI